MMRSFLRPLALVATTGFGAVLVSFVGCGDTGTTSGGGDNPNDCVGGIVVDTVCEGKCSDDLCVADNVCVHNRCKLECTSHEQCFAPFRGDSVYQGCLPDKEDTDTELNAGQDVYVCTDVNKASNLLQACPLGNECDSDATTKDWACPDGSQCTEGMGSDHCSAAECRPLVCLGGGQGDADAYCTITDCTKDDDCAPGMYCTVDRFPNKICNSDPQKGTDDPCIDPADFNKDGATWQEGPVSILRNVCKKREPCAPCTLKTDCSLAGDEECVKLGAEQVCAKTCTTADDCPNDFTCASGYCVPQTGACAPPPTDNFCYSCINDLQCGPGTGTVACTEVSGKQRACFDTTFPDTCTVDNDCPTSPSGRHGECLDEGEGLAPGDGAYHRCYFPFVAGSGTFQCYLD